MLFKNPAAIIIHLALVVIVAGALITHFCGVQGTVTLNFGGEPQCSFEVTSGPSEGRFPFFVQAQSGRVEYRAGTSSPGDFATDLKLSDGDGKEVGRARVSMNRVPQLMGWRFYQTAIGAESTTLTVSHDPVGIAVTYSGYVLLGAGMLMFFFTRRSYWRSAVKRLAALCVAFTAFSAMSAAGSGVEAMPRTLQRPLAHEFGKLWVWNGVRVEPMHVFASDFVKGVYGSSSYRGLTPEQVITGWLFFYDDWKHEPFLKIKGEQMRQLVGGDRTHVALTEMFGSGGYLLDRPGVNRADRSVAETDARVGELSAVVVGDAFKLLPVACADGSTEWLSWADRKPGGVDADVWFNFENALEEMSACVAEGRNVRCGEIVNELVAMQNEYLKGVESAGNRGYLLSPQARHATECFYFDWMKLWPVGAVGVLGGVVLTVLSVGGQRRRGRLRMAVRLTAAVSLMWVVCALVLRGLVSGYVPMTNGHETMALLGALAFAGALFVPLRVQAVGGGLLLVGGLASLVAAMSGASAQIGPLMPVLASPWLSLHVMLVMAAYALAALMAVLSVVGLLGKGKGDADVGVLDSASLLNEVLLVPTVFLLAAGIFVGAVWANQSWGRYWGWDPKETCALVTMLIYALPVHARSVGIFRSARVRCVYLLVAFASVLFTYFGANYFLGGLHSYA